VVPASEKEPEGWGAADKFTVVLETAGLNDTELGAYCRERGLFPEQVVRWRQAAQDANAKPVLTVAEQKDLEKLRAQDQREIRQLKKELQRKEKALAEAAALLILRKKWEAFCSEDAEG
jgi:transposase-like protein